MLRSIEAGVGKLTAVVFGMIVAVLLYSGYKIIPFFYSFYEIQNQMESVVRVADVESDKSIRNKLWYHIKKLGIPVEPEDLKINRDGRSIKVSLPYKEVFYITYKGKDYDLYVFDFNAHAEWQY